MAMEKEALTHKIEDDLAARNRNWDKVDSLQTAHNDLEAAHSAHLADYATHKADYATTKNRLGALQIVDFNLPSQSSVTLTYGHGNFICLLAVQGSQSNLHGSFILQGYGAGGARYNMATLQKGSGINVTLPDEGSRNVVVTNTTAAPSSGIVMMLYGSAPVVG